MQTFHACTIHVNNVLILGTLNIYWCLQQHGMIAQPQQDSLRPKIVKLLAISHYREKELVELGIIIIKFACFFRRWKLLTGKSDRHANSQSLKRSFVTSIVVLIYRNWCSEKTITFGEWNTLL